PATPTAAPRARRAAATSCVVTTVRSARATWRATSRSGSGPVARRLKQSERACAASRAGSRRGTSAAGGTAWTSRRVSVIAVLVLVGRLALAGVFAVAGAAKLADRAGTRDAVAAFGVPERLASPAGLLLPLAELATAVLLLPAAT